MYRSSEIVPVQLRNEGSTSEKGKPAAAKLAMRVKRKDGSEALIYNDINNYILQTILKELLSNALRFISSQTYLYCVQKNRLAKRN